ESCQKPHATASFVIRPRSLTPSAGVTIGVDHDPDDDESGAFVRRFADGPSFSHTTRRRDQWNGCVPPRRGAKILALRLRLGNVVVPHGRSSPAYERTHGQEANNESQKLLSCNGVRFFCYRPTAFVADCPRVGGRRRGLEHSHGTQLARRDRDRGADVL